MSVGQPHTVGDAVRFRSRHMVSIAVDAITQNLRIDARSATGGALQAFQQEEACSFSCDDSPPVRVKRLAGQRSNRSHSVESSQSATRFFFNDTATPEIYTLSHTRD